MERGKLKQVGNFRKIVLRAIGDEYTPTHTGNVYDFRNSDYYRFNCLDCALNAGLNKHGVKCDFDAGYIIPSKRIGRCAARRTK